MIRLKLLEIQQKILRKTISLLSNNLTYYSEATGLPNNNYPAHLDIQTQRSLYDKFFNSGEKYKPYPGVTFPQLPHILQALYGENQANLFDFGARNLDHFAHLSKVFPKIQYFYHDLPQYNDVVGEFKKITELKNIFVVHSLDELPSKIDFIFLGSVLQYISDYKKLLTQLFECNANYIFVAGQVCYENKIENSEVIFAKQLNILPQVNHNQFFHYESLVDFFNERDYALVSQSLNQTDKFINYKSFSKDFGEIENLDLFFCKR